MSAAVPDPLRAAARRHPEATAIITPERTLSYAALDQAVTATEARLRELGIRMGDRVAWYLPRGASALVLVGALLRRGAVAAPMSTRLPPQGVKARLKQINASHCITGRGEVASAAHNLGISVHSPSASVTFSAPEAIAEERSLRLSQPATIIFTSGSTGSARAALHTWGNHYYNAIGSAQNIPLAPGDLWLLSLPLYHVGGFAIVVRCLLAGATIVIPPADPSIGAACAKHRVTHLSLVATQLRRLLREGRGAASASLKAVLVGGGPVPFELLREVHERGWPVCTTYGCTEMASQVTTTRPGADLDALQTAGRVLPHRELRVAENGEIWVRGKTLFRGYVEQDTIRDPRNEAGWYPTGDIGNLDENGRLCVTGRVDHQFISGGENIQPEEIERVLQQVEGVEQAIVVPVSDDEFGERPVAFIRMSTGEPSSDRLMEELEQRLPRFKIPDRFYAWPQEVEARGIKTDRMWFQRQARCRIKKNL